MKVYCVFSAFGDVDGYTAYDITCVAANKDRAIKAIVSLVDEWCIANRCRNFKPVHKDMKNYTYFGNRKDCNYDCDCGTHGGYVVEEMEVLE